MIYSIIAISGRVASGKSTLAKGLTLRFGGQHVRTADLLRDLAERNGDPLPETRRDFQEYGDRMDDLTDCRWVVDELARRTSDLPRGALLAVDAIRKTKQLTELRRAFGRRISHVHLTAPLDEIARRYADRDSRLRELPSYDEVQDNPTEARIEELAGPADIAIDTARNQPVDVEIRCAARLGLLPDRRELLVDVVVGGQYGSEGKGNVAYYLAPEYEVLVRVGGPNAGHKVPLEPPFTHRQLPSGTLSNEDALLVIGPGATLDIDLLLEKIAQAGVEHGRLWIDPLAFVIEDRDKEAEAEGREEVGSTTSGAGAATARRILEARLTGADYRTAGDVERLRPFIRPTGEALEAAAAHGASVLLEGTQGSGLSLYHGKYPFVTSRDTNVGGLLAETGIPPAAIRRVIMVTRTYPIRVGGNSGPMGTEISFDEIASRADLDAEELHKLEVGSATHRPRRVAEFDWAMLRSAAQINSATDVALTFTDYLAKANGDAFRYDQLTHETQEFVEDVELVAGCPVSMLSSGFGLGRGLIDRRTWRGDRPRRQREQWNFKNL